MGGDPISLNQRVQGSSPCAPTIDIKDLAHGWLLTASQKIGLGSAWEAARDFCVPKTGMSRWPKVGTTPAMEQRKEERGGEEGNESGQRNAGAPRTWSNKNSFPGPRPPRGSEFDKGGGLHDRI
jgi:hypothetical protein